MYTSLKKKRDVRKRHICEMSERDIYVRCPKETYMRDVRKRHICEMFERDIYVRCPKETYMRHNLRCSKIKYTHEAERISKKTCVTPSDLSDMIGHI